jgi:hypothetical protein
MRARLRPLLTVAATLAIGASLLAVPAAAAPSRTPSTSPADVSTPVVFAKLGGCFSGALPNASTDVDIVWKDRLGNTKGSYNVEAPDGLWEANGVQCFNGGYVAARDTITVTDNDNAVTRTVTIKSLTGRFNRNTDVVSGKVPNNGDLHLTVERLSVATLVTLGTCEIDTPHNSDGTFSIVVRDCRTGYDPTGGDLATLHWQSPLGDQVTLDVLAPYVSVTVKSPDLSGVVGAGRSVKLTLRDGSGALRGRANAVDDPLNGRFVAAVRKHGEPVKPRRGDVVTGDWDGSQSYTVASLTLSAQAGDGVVSGHCTPQTRYEILVFYNAGGPVRKHGKTNASGNASMDLGGNTLQSLDFVVFACARTNGDRTAVARSIP